MLKIGCDAQWNRTTIHSPTYNDKRRQIALDLMAAGREVARFYYRDNGRSVGNGPISIDMAEMDNVDFQAIRN